MRRRFNEGISINPTEANLPSCCNWCDPNKKKVLGGDNLIALVENCRHLEALELIARGIGRETTETILRMVSEGEEDSFALNEIELIGYPFRIHNTVSKGW
eukprot:scaffold9658_cov201-Alexandrium_tamarense.AAC.5